MRLLSTTSLWIATIVVAGLVTAEDKPDVPKNAERPFVIHRAAGDLPEKVIVRSPS